MSLLDPQPALSLEDSDILEAADVLKISVTPENRQLLIAQCQAAMRDGFAELKKHYPTRPRLFVVSGGG